MRKERKLERNKWGKMLQASLFFLAIQRKCEWKHNCVCLVWVCARERVVCVRVCLSRHAYLIGNAQIIPGICVCGMISHRKLPMLHCSLRVSLRFEKREQNTLSLVLFPKVHVNVSMRLCMYMIIISPQLLTHWLHLKGDECHQLCMAA